MSINKFYDIPPSLRERNFPASFKSLKVNGSELSNTQYTVGDMDVDYTDDKDEVLYVNTTENGNTSLYGYTTEPHYRKDDYVPSFGGILHEVYTQQELLDAITNSNDGDRIELKQSITFSLGQSLSFPSSVKLFSNPGGPAFNLYSTMGIGAATYFIDIFSEDFQIDNINISVGTVAVNSAAIRLNLGVKNFTMTNCSCFAYKVLIASYSENLYIYDNTFKHLGLAGVSCLYVATLNRLIDVKRNEFQGNENPGQLPGTVALSISSLTSVTGGEIFFEENLVGLEISGKEVSAVIDILGIVENLSIYLHDNEINTVSSVVIIREDDYLEGYLDLQATANIIKVRDTQEESFDGVFLITDSSGSPAYPPNNCKIRSYGNIIPRLGYVFQPVQPVPTSTIHNPVLTYDTNFFTDPPHKNINPPLLARISIDVDTSDTSDVKNPMLSDLNANSKNISSVNVLSTDNIQAPGSNTLNVLTGIDMNNNNIEGVNLIKANTIQGTTVNGLRIHSDLIPDADGLYELGGSNNYWSDMHTNRVYTDILGAKDIAVGVEVTDSLIASGTVDIGGFSAPFDVGHFTTMKINNLDTMDTGNYLDLKCNIEPDTNSLYDIGTVSNILNNIYSEKVILNEMQAITGAITSNNSIAPNTNNTKDFGSSSNMWRDIYATRLRTDFLDGKTNPTITLQGNLTPDTNNNRTLGETTLVYSDIYTRQVGSDATLMFRPSNNNIYRLQLADTYLRPITDNQKSLGLAGNRYTTVYAVNGSISTSSRTMKKNIMDCKMGLDFINKMNPKMYHYNEDDDTDDKRCGLIYEEVKEVVEKTGMPFKGLHKSSEEIIDEEGEGTGEFKEYYGIHYESFIPILITSVKELKTQNETLMKRIEALEKK